MWRKCGVSELKKKQTKQNKKNWILLNKTMAESAGSPGSVVAANSPQQPQPQQQQQQPPQTQQQTQTTQQPPDISSSQLTSPPITGTGIYKSNLKYSLIIIIFFF